MSEEKRLARWWMGGVAAAAAGCFTQGLDTVKVQMQVQQGPKISMFQLTKNIIKEQGIVGLNKGLTAATLRQLTYSTVRFAFYEVVKQHIETTGKEVSFIGKVGIAAIGGAIGGFIGTPADVINVRMQNDIRLPPEKRRNYKHVFDGLRRIYYEEGFKQLFAGASPAVGRSVFMTVGQISVYDQTKQMLLQCKRCNLSDNMLTHFVASTIAGAIATSLTQPLDVLKTRRMNAKSGEFKNWWELIKHTASLGPQGFFKGYVLRFVRLAPHTILTFIFFEQLRLNFGYLSPNQ